MPPKIAKLAGLGAFGACAGLLALYLGLVFLTRPVASGGIDGINSAVAWISLGGLILALTWCTSPLASSCSCSPRVRT